MFRLRVLQEDAPGGCDDKWSSREDVCSLSEGKALFAELLRCFVNGGVFPLGRQVLGLNALHVGLQKEMSH